MKKNSQIDKHYEYEESRDGKFYFDVRAPNGQVVGTSIMFASTNGRDAAIEQLKKEAPKAEVIEENKEEVQVSEKEEAKKLAEERKEPEVFEKKEVEKVAEEKKEAQESIKSRLYTLLICLFFGWAGGHRYYVNKSGTGLLILFAGGGSACGGL